MSNVEVILGTQTLVVPPVVEQTIEVNPLTMQPVVVSPPQSAVTVILSGPPGPPGQKGDPGADSTVPGPPGADSTVPGPPGNDGAPGADSTVPGPPGADGADGSDGADSVVPGPKGDKGDTGAASTVPGPKGDTGDSGVAIATLPLTYNVGTKTVAINPASGSASGSMSAADKTKLDAVPATLILPPTYRQPLKSGVHYGQGFGSTAVISSFNVAGFMRLSPVFFAAGSYASVIIKTTANAVATWRFGLYPMLSDGGVDWANVWDAGTINMNSTPGLLEIIGTKVLSTSAWYWAAVQVDSGTGQPTVYQPGSLGASIAPDTVLPGMPLTPFFGNNVNGYLAYGNPSPGSLPTSVSALSARDDVGQTCLFRMKAT